MILALLACTVIHISDADTFRCDDGRTIRVAAINARERGGGCNAYPCPDMRHRQALPIARSLLLGKQVQLRIVGMNGHRFVAVVTLPDGTDLGCRLIAAGAATDWAEWRRRYGMEGCGR